MASNGRHPAEPVTSLQEHIEVQKGYPLVGLLAMTSLATLGAAWSWGPHAATTLLLIPQLFAMVCFCTLLIRVKDRFLSWQFGPGWIQGKVALSEIITTRIVMTPFAYGWGFRRTAKGWRFNRGGSLALEIHCRGGKRLRLGTAQAHQLQHCLESDHGHRH